MPGGDVSRLEGQGGFVVLESASELETLSANEEIEGSIVADLYHDQPPQWTKALAAAALKGIPVYRFRLIEESLTGEVRVTHCARTTLARSFQTRLPTLQTGDRFEPRIGSSTRINTPHSPL